MKIKALLKKPQFHYMIIGLLLMTLPFLAEHEILFRNSVVTLICGVMIYSVAGLGLDLLLGYSGMISLGTAGFMGLAAYLAAYFTETLNLPFLFSALVSIAIPVILGILVGLASLRIKGIYLAVATMVVAEILKKLFEEVTAFTGGQKGASVEYPTIFDYNFDRTSTFVLVVAFLVLGMILKHLIVNSRPGRALLAMRGSEVAAQAMGVNLLSYRLLAFSLATGYAALAGVLYMHYFKTSYPSIWGLVVSLNILAAVIVGGSRSTYGTLIGAFIIFAFPDLVLKKLPVIGEISGISLVFNGIVIIAIIIFYPQGIVRIAHDVKLLITRAREKKGLSDNDVG